MTEPSTDPSGSRAARGGLLLQLGIQLGSVGSTLVLARLLAPSDFGIIAIANSVLALATLLTASGVGAALTRAADRVEERASTYFCATFVAGLALSAAMAGSSPVLAAGLGQPKSWAFIAALSPVLVLSSLASIPTSLLYRSERFTAVYRTTAFSTGTYFATQVTLAFAGAGPWSVIIGQLLGAVLTLLLAMAQARWLPRSSFNLGLIRSDLKFLVGSSTTQILTYVIRNSDYWIVSRMLGPTALGGYYIAYVLPNILRQRVSWAVTAVLFVHVVKSAEDRGRQTALWRQVWCLQAGVGLPALAGIAVLADPLTLVLFGQKWAYAVDAMRVACGIALVDLHMVTVNTIATARGQVGLSVRTLTVKAIACVAGVLIGVTLWGTIMAAAIGVLVGSALAAAVQERLVVRVLGVGLLDVLPQLAAFSACTTGMSIVVLALERWMDPSPIVTMMVLPPLGALCYLSLGLLVFRPTFRDLLVALRRLARAK